MTAVKGSVADPPSRTPVLMLRADAGVRMGTGHVMRCLALAQAWQDLGGRAIFAMAESTEAIEERLKLENAEVVRLAIPAGTLADADCLATLAQGRDADWVVVDGYHFGPDYQRALKGKGCRILFLDDYGHGERYVADLVLNQNAQANPDFYKDRSSESRLLLGSRYVLLRREFRAWQKWPRVITSVASRILVTLGGSDPEDVTSRVLQAVDEVQDQRLEVVVIAGGSNPHLASLHRHISQAQHDVRLVKNAENMAELMAWADVAVSAAGATCWEMCLLGLPAVVVDLAPNQVPIARELHRRGIAIYAGSANALSPSAIAGPLCEILRSVERRSTMSRMGRELVDGNGAARVAALLRGAEIPGGPRDHSSSMKTSC